jgi:hypothetical protein
MRLRANLRCLLACSMTIGTLFVLPGTAAAAPNFSLSMNSTGPYVSGETATWTVDVTNIGDAIGGSTGSFVLRDIDGNDATIVGKPVTGACTTGANQASQVTTTTGSPTVDTKAAFANGCARVTFTALLPPRYVFSFRMSANGAGALNNKNATSELVTVKKGGPSQLASRPAPGAPQWVLKDGTLVAEMRITNHGTGPAEFTRASVNITGYPNAFSPWWAPHPAFTPTATLTGGCTPDAFGCLVGTIAAGGSATVQVTATGLTHYGTAGISVSSTSADSLGGSQHYLNAQVTDGSTNEVHVGMDGPLIAAGGTDAQYRGELVNAGPGPFTGQLGIDTSGFVVDGELAESIRSITLSNGAACVPRLDHSIAPPVVKRNSWDCPIADLAPGQRQTFDVVANFPTAAVNMSVWMQASVQSTAYITFGSTRYAAASTTLNVAKVVDLEPSVSSQALVGPGRIAAVAVTVRNNGNATADAVLVEGAVRGVGGAFQVAALPGTCTGASKPMFTSCNLGSIAPGASKRIVFDVKAGTKLGALALTFDSAFDSVDFDTFETNRDNDSVTHVLHVTKASDVPLGAKVFTAPSVNATQLAGKGLRSHVKCPTTCRATIQLRVKRDVARQMGLTLPKQGDVLVGTARKASAANGNTIVFVKLMPRHRAAFIAYRRPVVLQRTTTAVSTAARNLGATTTATQNVTVKPAPAARR